MRVLLGFTSGIIVTVTVLKVWRVVIGWALSRGD